MAEPRMMNRRLVVGGASIGLAYVVSLAFALCDSAWAVVVRLARKPTVVVPAKGEVRTA